jgi:hypothetical protein
MNRLFLALDADNAGRNVGQAVLMDDAQMLHDISQKIDAGTNAVKDMILALGGQIISAGGDEMTAMLDPQHESKIEEMRAKYEEITGFSASIGLGNSLSQAGKALIAAKLTGKDKTVRYDQSVEDIINQAHQAVQDGTADEEQQKMDEHYIADTMDDEQAHMDEDMSSEDSESYEASPEDMIQKPEDEDVEDSENSEPFEPSPYDMIQKPEDVEDSISEDHMLDEENEEMPEEEEQQAEPSEFEQEPTITLEGEDVLDENQEDPNAEKADPEMEGPEMATEADSLVDDLADADGNEEILQRIAANLDAFKQNKDLMEQIKEAKPELYSAMLGLLYNMIELARMISPEAVSPEQEEAVYVPSGNDYQQQEEEEEQQQLPKQRG